jgi:hypothetical protein
MSRQRFLCAPVPGYISRTPEVKEEPKRKKEKKKGKKERKKERHYGSLVLKGNGKDL